MADVCVGDCGEECEVSIDELIQAVGIILGDRAVSVCPQADADGDNAVFINELVQAVGNALNGCSKAACGGATPTPTPTPTPSRTGTPPTPTPTATPTATGERTCAGQPCNDTAQTLFTGGAAVCPGGTCSVLDGRSVVLSTAAHASVTYKLTVTGVRDSAGSAIMVFGPRGDIRNQRKYQGRPVEALRHCPAATAEETLASGRCRPIPCGGDGTCPGGAPCRDQIPDCDGDGLTDDVEARGWTVRITNGGERLVTSNPLRVDTDGDGLTDGVEMNEGYSPRDADSDDDGLTDYQEIYESYTVTVEGLSRQQTPFQARSNPVLADSDSDGLSDLQERMVLHTAADRRDTDGDGMADNVEPSRGTEPLDVDTDNNGTKDRFCAPQVFRFDIAETAAGNWPGGTATQTSAQPGCSATIRLPRGPTGARLDSGDQFGLVSFAGFSTCADADTLCPGDRACGCSVNSCPGAIDVFCLFQRPNCVRSPGTPIGGASASYFVQCE